MERRHFISVAGGLGLGLLIPGVVYRYLMRGTNVGNVNIRALPPYETTLTLECISNSAGGRFIGNAKWTGILLKPIIERADILPAAKYAVFYAAEGYTTGHPISRVDDPTNFLAYNI